MPQLYFVPVRPSASRSAHSKGISASPSTLTGRPFAKKSIMASSYEPVAAARDRQRPDPLTGGGEDGVADRGMGRHRTEFADAGRPGAAFDEAGFDAGGLPEVQRVELIEIGLLDLAVGEGHLGAKPGQTPDHAALDIGG